MRRLSCIPAILIIALLYTVCLSSINRAYGDETITLSNGLRVILAPIEASPTVYTAVYVKAGSIYEEEYLGCGISHFVEHTLSASTRNLTHEEIENIKDRIGGVENAYTTYDHTCYHITTTPSNLPDALYLLSSYVRYAAFDEFYVNQEKEVILREIAMGEDEPRNVIYKRFVSTMMREHPIRYPIIGYTDLFKKLTREDLVGYYERMYHPENTVVVISGDFERDTAMALIDEYFAEWERSPNKNPVMRREPPQIGERRIFVEEDGNLSHVFVGFHTVPITDPDMYPVDVLSTIIGGSESSLLERELIQKGLAYTANSYSYTPHFGAGYLAIYAMCAAGREKDVERAILDILTKIDKEISEDDISTVKRRVRRRYQLSIQTPEDKARILFSNELSVGDINFTDTYLANLDKVTKDEVINVWEKYITRDNMTVAILGRATPAEEAESEIAPSPSGHWTDDIKCDSLGNGIKLLIRENHNSSVVSIQLVTLGGVRIESEGNNGISNLMLKTITRSTAKRDAQILSHTLDDMGTRLKTFVGNNSMGISIDVIPEDLEKGIKLLSEVINYPSFDEIATARIEVLGEIERQNERPQVFALNIARENLYGTHPYSLKSRGSKEVVLNLTREQLEDFYSRYLPTKKTAVSVFGNVDKDEASLLLKNYFGGTREARTSVEESIGVDFPDSILVSEQIRNFQQVVLCMAFPGIDNRDPDRFAFDVMDAVLTGSYIPSGWLHQILRGEGKGYAYWMHGGNIVGIDRGMYYLIAGTSEQYLDTVRIKMLDIVNGIQETLVSDKEMEIAKTRCLMAHATSLEKNSDMGINASLNEIYALGYSADRDYESNIMGVTQSDVKRVANDYLNEYVLVIVRPEI